MPTVPTFAVRETDVSRHNGGTSGASLKPPRDDSSLRALSSLRGLRGAPEVPPLCRETSVSRTANVGTVGKNSKTLPRLLLGIDLPDDILHPQHQNPDQAQQPIQVASVVQLHPPLLAHALQAQPRRYDLCLATVREKGTFFYTIANIFMRDFSSFDIMLLHLKFQTCFVLPGLINAIRNFQIFH